jgi:hypothetical protein
MEPGQTQVIGSVKVVFPGLPKPAPGDVSRAAAVVALPLRKGMTQRCACVAHKHGWDHSCHLPILRFGVARAILAALEKVQVHKPRNFAREEQAGPSLLHMSAATPGMVSMTYIGRECAIGSTPRVGIAVEQAPKLVITLDIAGGGVQIVELHDMCPSNTDQRATHILRGVSNLVHRSEHTRRMAYDADNTRCCSYPPNHAQR